MTTEQRLRNVTPPKPGVILASAVSPKDMAHHHPDGYYWHKEYRHSDWTVVRVHRSRSTVEPVVTFLGRSDGTGRKPVSLEELTGELVGPLRDPSAPNLHS